MCAAPRENLYRGFATRPDTNRAVQIQKMDRGLKIRIKEVEGLYRIYVAKTINGTGPLCGSAPLFSDMLKKQVVS